MHMQQQRLAKRATALLSAIAATSFLGLPALAGGLSGEANSSGGQAQVPISADQAQCTPATQSNLPSNTATPDAAAIGAAQLPNQADPRTGIAPSDQSNQNQSVPMVSDRAAGSTNASSVQATAPSGTRSDGNAQGDTLTQGGATTGGSASQQVSTANNPEAYGSADGQYSANRQNSAYGDVLSQGGATAGGFASQQVSAANNPEAYRTVSSRYTSNKTRANYIDGSAATSSTMSQPATQSSRMTTGMTIAQCPTGVPQSSTPANRQAPDQTNPGVQTPRQTDQTTDPQMRQSPADDNGSRAR